MLNNTTKKMIGRKNIKLSYQNLQFAKLVLILWQNNTKNHRMKLKLTKTGILLFILITFTSLSAQNLSKSYLAYIQQYHQIAERQQKEHGIPASIILAQGLLESGAGQSVLTKMSNNHFGIKCTDWNGDKVYYDDDAKNECFRKYDQALDSYEDHALFLKNRSRYAFLFDLKPTDYEGWAFGLKKAGYATDPAYGFKLISIIENYKLHQFDLGKNVDYADNSTAQNSNNNGSLGSIQATITHEIYRVNRVKCVNALQGDSYASIADEYNISENRLRDMNEVSPTDGLVHGMRVFLNYKKHKADKSVETHTVELGESMHSIAQDYGVITEDLYKMNQMDYSEGAKLGQVLRMR
jgi:LysM repeat protein